MCEAFFVWLCWQLAGVHSTTVTTLPDGTFNLDELESKIRHDYPDPHFPRSRLICVENTHNIQGGRVLPLPFLQEVHQYLQALNTAEIFQKPGSNH